MAGQQLSRETESDLGALIADRIRSNPQGQITFAEFMDLASYHPQLGYYSRPGRVIGPRGDYYTSVQVSPVFAELLAEHLREMWIGLGEPSPFHIVEMGAGDGTLATDLLSYVRDHHPGLWSTVEYRIVERSQGLIAQQRQRLREFERVSWWELNQIGPETVTGCFFSNELLDAFPVHRVELRGGQLKEIYVRISPDSQRFEEHLAEVSTPRICEYFERLGIYFSSESYEEGYRTEVNLAALDWLHQIGSRLRKGYLLTIDYGFTARRYYHPTRSQGTLLCYRQHMTHADPYVWVGEQDLTAHVDVTALQEWGSDVGLDPVGLTRQEAFLASLGLLDRLADVSQREDRQISEALQRRQSLHLLIDPMGLGNYQVLLQAKGLTDLERSAPLKGFNRIG